MHKLDFIKQSDKSKDEIIFVTEQVLDAQGIECDFKISKLSEEKIREILNEVRKKRRKLTHKEREDEEDEEDEERKKELEEPISKTAD